MPQVPQVLWEVPQVPQAMLVHRVQLAVPQVPRDCGVLQDQQAAQDRLAAKAALGQLVCKANLARPDQLGTQVPQDKPAL